MTTTEGETSAPPAADVANPAPDGQELPPPEPEQSTSLRRPPLRMAAPAIAAAGLALAIAGRKARGRRDAGDGGVLFAGRPRKVLWRYAGTLGLWEVARRATRFTVTDRYIRVNEGVLRQSVEQLPLQAIQSVRLSNGPWQGYVEVRGAEGAELLHRRIGPLRTPVARRLAALLAERTER